MKVCSLNSLVRTVAIVTCLGGLAHGQNYNSGSYPGNWSEPPRPGAQIAGGVLQIIGGALASDPRNHQAANTLNNVGSAISGRPNWNATPQGPMVNIGGNPGTYPNPMPSNQWQQQQQQQQWMQQQQQQQQQAINNMKIQQDRMRYDHEQNMARQRAEQARIDAQQKQNLANQQAQMERDRKYAERQRTGAAFGTVLGGYVGGQPGAVAGGQVGSAVGPDVIREGINARQSAGKELKNAQNSMSKGISNAGKSLGKAFKF